MLTIKYTIPAEEPPEVPKQRLHGSLALPRGVLCCPGRDPVLCKCHQLFSFYETDQQLGIGEGKVFWSGF